MACLITSAARCSRYYSLECVHILELRGSTDPKYDPKTKTAPLVIDYSLGGEKGESGEENEETDDTNDVKEEEDRE